PWGFFLFELPPQPDPKTAPPPPPQPTRPKRSRWALLRRAANALLLKPTPHTLRDAVWPENPPAGPAVLDPLVARPLSLPQPDTLTPFAILPCGTKFLVRGAKSRIELRSFPSGEVLTVWKWGLPRTLSIAVAADGMTAAAAGIRGRLVIWDLE